MIFCQDFYNIQSKKTMDKQNTHPNLLHLNKNKKNHSPWVHLSSEPRISQFKTGNQNQWKKKIFSPSQKQKEIDKKLSKMLNIQKSCETSKIAHHSQEKYISSFISSVNHTLQKYFKETSSPIRQESSFNRKKELTQILLLLYKVFECKIQVVEQLSEQQLINLIKSNLKILTSKKQCHSQSQ